MLGGQLRARSGLQLLSHTPESESGRAAQLLASVALKSSVSSAEGQQHTVARELRTLAQNGGPGHDFCELQLPCL